ncbi:hypothetical protein [Aromatoleum sp.]|uniref:hypothetical protein n=1 Tax=Aromatoleum sp. TaxID=2307007 RepID=UPI002FC69D9B
MFSRSVIATALIGIGAAAFDGYYSERTDPQRAALDASVCTAMGGVRYAWSPFFRLAAAQSPAVAPPPKTEVGPFSRAVAEASTAQPADANPELRKDLGTLHFPITTSVRQAQQYFNQGLRLSYGFNHGEALRAFRKARTLDPDCAMCYWGEALVQGPNINAPMTAQAMAPAFEAMTRAQALAAKTEPKERALIEALAQRYAAPPAGATGGAPPERAELDRAYAQAMKRVAAAYPADIDIAALTAEALMDLQPWDHWEAGGHTPKGETATILALLERSLEKQPNHAGAIHFYIHMTEASSDPARAVPYAKRLGNLMPGAGHVVHMPFHTYFRVGMYKEAVEANRKAVRVDEAYIARAAPVGIYPMAYYPHNVHSLMVSAQMAGDAESALAAAEKLDRIVSAAAAAQVSWVQPIKVAPYFAHAQFSPPQTILALPDPGTELPFVKAMWHYARGVGFARAGERERADAEAGAIANLNGSNEFPDLVAGGVPAKDILQLAEEVVRGRMAQAAGDHRKAVGHFEEAVRLEDSLAYTEPPYWYYPTRQSLGAALLLAGEPERAELVLRSSLARASNNGWALFALMKSYEQQGDAASSRVIRRKFERAWLGDRKMLDLTRL